MIVLDASAALELLFRTSVGKRVEARLLEASAPLHVPHVFDLEVTNALRRGVRQALIPLARAEEMVLDLEILTVVRHAHHPFVARIWELRDALTAYDAAYVALAESLDGPMITCDRRLAAAKGHHARIEVI